MALSESESVAYGGMKSALHAHPPRSPPRSSEFMTDLSASSPLSKQNSIFSLTLDEIQLKSGRSVGSMNMDEFLANLWNNGEENQVSSQTNQNKNHQTLTDKESGAQSPNQQISIPTPLCKKTVDEVWSEIQKDLPSHRKSSDISRELQSEHTFGEMTLEDFLVKAGVVQGPEQKKANPNPPQSANFGIGQQNVNLVTTPIQNNTVSNLEPSYGMGNVIGMGYPGTGNNYPTNGYVAAYPVFTQSKGFFGESSSTNGENGSMMEAGMVHIKKRIIDGPPEVVVERRQRRMIKNRESAARSRARKQAYTVELELELNQLREENEKLKQVLEENEEKRKQEVLKRKQKSPLMQKRVEKLKTIRRTNSSGW